MAKGKLYLIPSPIVEGAIHTIPAYVIEQLHKLDFFIAERAKTARHFIKASNPVKAFSELTFFELNKHTPETEKLAFLDPALAGHDIGLLSEAGCPGVADPGALIVKMAHQKGIEVIPLVGPSSILLALMASGMNGQSFVFHGYLSAKAPGLARDLKRLENQAAKFHQTQIFIEAPYRNRNVVDQALKVLNPATQFCIAVDISGPNAFIKTFKIKDWKQKKMPDLHKRPAIFLLFK